MLTRYPYADQIAQNTSQNNNNRSFVFPSTTSFFAYIMHTVSTAVFKQVMSARSEVVTAVRM
jgi:hypothetical protein